MSVVRYARFAANPRWNLASRQSAVRDADSLPQCGEFFQCQRVSLVETNQRVLAGWEYRLNQSAMEKIRRHTYLG